MGKSKDRGRSGSEPARTPERAFPAGLLGSPRAAEIDAVLAGALDQPTGPPRRAFLDTACAGKEELRREVEALLAAAIETDALLRPGGAIATPPPPDLPRRLGPYRLLREIGQGGMGTVYLAERVDGHYKQKVAVKVLRLGDQRSLARFHRERQILARLEHPAIARLYDGGTTPQGDPYLVMEYVEGEPIDRHCRERDLSIRQRLGLFLAVCEALRTAHRQLVVHQDIKPSNILVSNEGEAASGRVKLLDFGIATLLDDEPGVTATSRPMTPQYASPEQALNRATTVSSDIYQLGLLAYELLTDQRPYELDGSTAWRWKEQICDISSPPPSTVAAAAVASELAGDLDAIVLKCLRKEPERRYGSVDLLCQDLDRHLAGRPVSARPDTWRYRLGKFLGRHRAAVAAALVVSLAFLVLTVTFIQRLTEERNRTRLAADRALEERARAERNSAGAEQAVDFLVDLFDLSDPYVTHGRPPTVQQILDRGAERLDRELEDQPKVRARLLDHLGRIFSNLGQSDRARELASEALSIRQHTSGVSPVTLVDSLQTLARLDTADGELGSARTRLKKALGLAREGWGKDSLKVASILNDLGSVELQQGDYATAESHYRRAHDLYASLLGEDSVGEDSVMAATALQNLGIVLLDQGRWEESEDHFEKARRVYEEKLRPGHPRLGDVLNNLAVLSAHRGDYAAAVAFGQRVFSLKRESLGPDHPKLFAPMINLALSYSELEEYDEADRWAREALALQRMRPGRDDPEEAMAFLTLGTILINRGRPGEAEPMIVKALDLYRARLPAQGFRFGVTLNNLGEIRVAQGREPEALELFAESLGHLEQSLGPEHVYLASVMMNLGAGLYRQGQRDQADGFYRRALEIRAAVLPPSSDERRQTAADYAALLRELGREQEAQIVEQKLELPPG